ncbi:MAG: uridine kinase [Actinomycetota bacterium]
MTGSQVQVCAIAGGSGAGKTTLAMALMERLGEQATHHTIDWYYRDLSHMTEPERAVVNFDHPDSLEVDLFVDHLRELRAGRDIDAPVYDFASHTRSSKVRPVQSRPVIVAEGIHLLALEGVRALCDVLVFIDVDAEERLRRRIRRDVAERGRTEDSVRAQWAATVAPMHDEFVGPSAAHSTVRVTIDDDLDVMAERLARRLTSA